MSSLPVQKDISDSGSGNVVLRIMSYRFRWRAEDQHLYLGPRGLLSHRCSVSRMLSRKACGKTMRPQPRRLNGAGVTGRLGRSISAGRSINLILGHFGATSVGDVMLSAPAVVGAGCKTYTGPPAKAALLRHSRQ